jgi:carbon-monoxide dehydrogenase medium subunit
MTNAIREQQRATRLVAHRPTSVADVLALLQTHGSDASICMGGTDLVPRLGTLIERDRQVVCCSRLAALRRVEHVEDFVEIGAGVTYRELAGDDMVKTTLPSLAVLAKTIANPRVRNRGTLGGVVCAARDRSDPPTLLSALGAEAIVVSTRGQRALPIEHFIQGRRQTAMAQDELLTHIRVPSVGATTASFDRVGSSQGPLVNVAVSVREGATRLAVGGVTPVPAVVDMASDVSVTQLREAARGLAEQSWTADTALASRWYGGEVASRLVIRLLAHGTGGSA